MQLRVLANSFNLSIVPMGSIDFLVTGISLAKAAADSQSPLVPAAAAAPTQ
jgi:hypothetical protein